MKLTEADQTITPTYEDCTDTFDRTVHVNTNGAKYTFTTDGTVHVLGGPIVLTVTSGGSVICTVTVKEQTNNGITYHNLGGTNGIEVTTNTTNVVSTTSGGFFNCGVSNGEHKGGTYTGGSIVVGEGTDGKAAEIRKTPV